MWHCPRWGSSPSGLLYADLHIFWASFCSIKTIKQQHCSLLVAFLPTCSTTTFSPQALPHARHSHVLGCSPSAPIPALPRCTHCLCVPSQSLRALQVGMWWHRYFWAERECGMWHICVARILHVPFKERGKGTRDFVAKEQGILWKSNKGFYFAEEQGCTAFRGKGEQLH